MSDSASPEIPEPVETTSYPKHNKLVGFIVILLGVAAIAAPLLTQLSMAVITGWILIFAAVARGIGAILDRKEGGLWLGLFFSLLSLIVGVFILTNPIPSILTLTLLLAILFIAEGLILIVRGFSKRMEILNWSTWVVNGFVSGLLGVFILVNFPSSAKWSIGLLLGIYLILAGYRMMSKPATKE